MLVLGAESNVLEEQHTRRPPFPVSVQCRPLPILPAWNQCSPYRPLSDSLGADRYTFFCQLGLDDLLAIAYRETVAASSVPPGTEKAPAELDLKSWHTFVVRLSENTREFPIRE